MLINLLPSAIAISIARLPYINQFTAPKNPTSASLLQSMPSHPLSNANGVKLTGYLSRFGQLLRITSESFVPAYLASRLF